MLQALDLEIHGLRMWITIRFYGIWTLKRLGLQIWILIIYGSGLENTWAMNLDYNY